MRFGLEDSIDKLRFSTYASLPKLKRLFQRTDSHNQLSQAKDVIVSGRKYRGSIGCASIHFSIAAGECMKM